MIHLSVRVPAAKSVSKNVRSGLLARIERPKLPGPQAVAGGDEVGGDGFGNSIGYTFLTLKPKWSASTFTTATGYPRMLFGDPEHFAIEIGEVVSYPGFPGLYVQFRFWIDKAPIGDWDDRIPLNASTKWASQFRDMEMERQRTPFPHASSSNLFREVYDQYFSYDYTNDTVSWLSLNAIYHLDAIGMGAVEDKFGLILIATVDGTERLIAKNLKNEQFVGDEFLPLGTVQSTLTKYITWGQNLLREVRG